MTTLTTTQSTITIEGNGGITVEVDRHPGSAYGIGSGAREVHIEAAVRFHGHRIGEFTILGWVIPERGNRWNITRAGRYGYEPAGVHETFRTLAAAARYIAQHADVGVTL